MLRLLPFVIALSLLAHARPPVSRVVGTPEPPPPYRASVAFPNLKFNHPTFLARGGDRLFVGEQRGKIWSFENKPDAKAELAFDLRSELKSFQQHPGAKENDEIYSMAFHPTDRRTCFIAYTLKGKKNEKNLPDGSRVSRFTMRDTTPPTVDPASEQVLLTWLQGGHNGCDLQFGPDGMLYISTGDGTDPNPPDLFRTGQDITDLLSSILRIDVDHKDEGKQYSIPKDNPFIHTVQNNKPARGEVWAYGFRNPWRISFDRVTGDLWAGDVGWEAWEMIHKVERGGNYGWSAVEARQAVNTTWPVGPTPIRPPAIELDHSVAASVTGGFVYRGKKLPELAGKYIFGDWSTRRMWAATKTGDRCDKLEEITAPSVRVVAFGEDNAGELYFLDYDTGLVYTLAKNDATAFDSKQFPRTLSATGLFKDVKSQTINEGVVPYEINAEHYQDGAWGKRYLYLPPGTSVIDNDKRRTIKGDVEWHQYKYHFPKDAVLIKTITLPLDNRKLQPQQKVETQLLHFDGLDWHGYSYRWRADGRDADLVDADGAEQPFLISDDRVLGGQRELVWQYQSRTQCLQCHNFWAEHALGFSGPQLNRLVDGQNQLLKFAQAGLMTRADKAGKPKLPHNAFSAYYHPKLVNPAETTEFIDTRARSYLHANCAHCHRFGGGGAVEFELNFDRDLRQAKSFEPPVRGDFGIAETRVIAKGDPGRSILFYRMAKHGSGRMPHLGSDIPDDAGLDLIHMWISRMSDSHPPYLGEDIPTQLKTVRGALDLARAAACDCTPKEERERILNAAKPLPPGPIRDLFEGYLTLPGGERKLGPNPKPKAILSLEGDAAKGKEIFLNASRQCVNCHKHEGVGQEIGPPLKGLKRTKADLLESLLDPSRRVEPAYQAYSLKTAGGASLGGIIASRNEKEIAIRAADGKVTVVPTGDVESLMPSRASLMPGGLIADITPQQAADLLAWLTQLQHDKP